MGRFVRLAGLLSGLCIVRKIKSSSECSCSFAKRRKIVVIGGGICGVSAAVFLAQKGHRVTLVERDQIGGEHQASAVNSGFIDVWTQAEAHNEDSLLLSLASCKNVVLEDVLCAGSRAILRRLQEEDGFQIGYRNIGLLWIAANEEQMERAKAEYPPWDGERHSPASGALLTRAQALELEPLLSESVMGAVRFPACATANPKKTMLALRAKAIETGVEILEQREIRGVERERGQWRVVARRFGGHSCVDAHGGQREEYATTADVLVIAAGGLAPVVGSLIPGIVEGLLPVTPVIGQMWSTPPEKELPDPSLLPRRRLE